MICQFIEALKKGAVSYIDKSASADELVKKLTAISKGHKSTTPPLLDPLTDREAEIIKAIGTGKTKHEIAQELYISERTLYNHIQSIYGLKMLSKPITRLLHLDISHP